MAHSSASFDFSSMPTASESTSTALAFDPLQEDIRPSQAPAGTHAEVKSAATRTDTNKPHRTLSFGGEILSDEDVPPADSPTPNEPSAQPFFEHSVDALLSAVHRSNSGLNATGNTTYNTTINHTTINNVGNMNIFSSLPLPPQPATSSTSAEATTSNDEKSTLAEETVSRKKKKRKTTSSTAASSSSSSSSSARANDDEKSTAAKIFAALSEVTERGGIGYKIGDKNKWETLIDIETALNPTLHHQTKKFMRATTNTPELVHQFQTQVIAHALASALSANRSGLFSHSSSAGSSSSAAAAAPASAAKPTTKKRKR